MEFKFAEIKDGMTKSEIRAEIERLKKLKIDYKNKNLALKIILNSVYGVAGYKGFVCYNKDVAQSITKQSEDLIKYTMKIFNDYFKEHWHLDTKLHEALKINTPSKVHRDVVNYADTDSVFLVLQDIYEKSGYNKPLEEVDESIRKQIENGKANNPKLEPESVQFIQFIFELRKYALDEYVDKKMWEYVDQRNGLQQKMSGDKAIILEMEQINHNILWTRKKKYIKNPMWDDGMFHENLGSIQVKGLELNQSSTPIYVREKLWDLVRYIMSQKGGVDTNELVKMLMKIKREFDNVDVQKICKYERVTNYNNLVLNDTTGLEFAKGIKPHAKGAAYYNFMLHNAEKEYKQKYEYIETGQRVHYYYTAGGEVEAFSFPSGMYPAEFAPPVNYSMQFEKVLLGPLNNILRALGIPELDASLTIFGGLW